MRLDELALKLLDDSINEDEIRELVEFTRTSEGKESLLRLMELESHLQAAGLSSVADRVLGQLQRERCDRVEEGVMRAVVRSGAFSVQTGVSSVQTGGSVQTRDHDAAKVRSSRLAFIVVGVAAIAACLLFVFSVVEHRDGNDSELAKLNPHGSSVSILDADGMVRTVSANGSSIALHASETIQTSQAIDSAEIVYADGTKIELLGETKIKLSETSDGSKRIEILSGLVQADVTPQPDGRPLRVVTQSATLEVLGTTLGVEVRDASTQLGVATGRVAMTRKADGQRVEVEAGRFATATESTMEPLQSHPFPALPAEWSEDFDDGLPAGWRSGELVQAQETTEVRAEQSRWTSDGRFVITSHNAWQEGDHGLFRIDKHSVLHLRIRQSRFARITIMIGTRSYPPSTGRIGGNLFYTKKAWNEDLPANTWRTVSVPLSELSWQMRRGKKTSGSVDLEGLAAYLVHVSTMNQDAGLAIDRIWVTNHPEGQSR